MYFRSLLSRWRTNRSVLNEEVKSRIHFGMSQKKVTPQYFLFQTPEFSKFVFLVPASFLFGISAFSISPLLFERIIPYHIRTVAFSLSFFTFVDLAISVVGRPELFSHYWPSVAARFAYTWGSVAMNSAAVVAGDTDPRTGYAGAMAAVLLHAVPTCTLAMPAWLRMWRLGLLSMSLVSLGSAWKQLNYLETNWHQLVHH